MSYYANLDVSDSVFQNNTGTNYGSFASWYAPEAFKFEGVTFRDNSVSSSYGALYMYTTNSFSPEPQVPSRFVGCEFDGNYAGGNAAGLYIYGYSIDMEGTSFTDNTCAYYGCGMYAFMRERLRGEGEAAARAGAAEDFS